jgi:hypothetical protein
MLNSILHWHQTFSHLTSDERPLAILNSDCELLYICPKLALDTASLSHAAQTVSQFFQVHPGDFFVLNDPLCGGLGSGDLTFVGKVQSFFVVTRSSFKEEWSFNTKAEFFKIPPTPLVSQNLVQQELLKALGASSSERLTVIEKQIQWFLQLGPKFQRLLSRNKNFDNKIAQKKYFAESLELIGNKIDELFHSEYQHEMSSCFGETLKIKNKLTDYGLVFDLSGTSLGHKIHIPESWTRGLFAHFLFDLIDESHLINQGSLSGLQIIQPMTSFTNCSRPENTFLGRHLGVPLLQTAIHQGFSRSHKNLAWGTHNYFPLKLQIKHNDHLLQFEVPSGSGPSAQKLSIDGLNTQDQKDWFPIDKLNELGIEVVGLTPRASEVKVKSDAMPGQGWKLSLKFKQKIQLKYLLSSDNLNNSYIEQDKKQHMLPYGELEAEPHETVHFYSGSAPARP